jgi:hypothetical protein
MLGEPFRFTPAGPASEYKTYAVTTPQTDRFWQKATCEDVDCEHFLHGWQTRVTAGGALAAAVLASGRPILSTEQVGAEVVFTFAPGTECFRSSEHRIKVGRPDLFLVREGDWRGNPRGTPARIHQRPEDWVEDFATHTQAIADRLEKG